MAKKETALTPVVWAFARAFYAHRQRRWRKLVAQGFRYETGRGTV